MDVFDTVKKAAHGLETIIAFETPHLRSMERIDAVALIGPQGGGKTTLASYARGKPGVVVPTRYLTRESRPDDDPHDTVALDDACWEDLNMQGRFGLVSFWNRTASASAFVGYARWDPESLAVLSGNTQMLQSWRSSPLDLYARTVFVSVSSIPEERRARLAMRSDPPIDPAIDAYRREHEQGYGDVLALNRAEYKDRVKSEFPRFLARLVEARNK